VKGVVSFNWDAENAKRGDKPIVAFSACLYPSILAFSYSPALKISFSALQITGFSGLNRAAGEHPYKQQRERNPRNDPPKHCHLFSLLNA